MEEIYQTKSTHVAADFYKVNEVLLNDNGKMIELITEAIKISGAELIDLNYHEFKPFGLTITAILSESSCDFHGYNEHSDCMFSIFTCGDKADPMLAVQYLKERLQPEHSDIMKIKRGTRGQMEVSLINS